jgi:hypothetical protein
MTLFMIMPADEVVVSYRFWGDTNLIGPQVPVI